MALRQIGILTLAQSDDTDSFNAFRQGLHGQYAEGKDVSLHFRFANGDNSKLKTLAQQLLDIPVEVIVTAGTRALNEVLGLHPDPNIRIIQAVGGEDPYGSNRTGSHINVLQLCRNQFSDLKGKGITELTILRDSTAQSTNAVNPFDTVKTDANTAGIPDGKIHEIDVKNYNELLTKLTATAVKGGFMVIPNGWFFNHCDFIAQTVYGAILNDPSIWAIFPEREYLAKLPNHPTNVLLRGHKIKKAYQDAADHVIDALTGNAPKPSKEADSDQYP